MPEQPNNNWFKFFLWALGSAVGAVISLQTALHIEMKGKIDRVTSLLMSERDRIYQVLDKICDKLSQHDVELAKQKEIIDGLRKQHDTKEGRK